MKPFYRWSDSAGLTLVVRESAIEIRLKNGVRHLDALETPVDGVDVEADGKLYRVAIEVLPALDERRRAPLSGFRMISACAREGVICTEDHLCRCCAVYSGTGSYPDKGPGHQRLMSVAEFFALQNVRAALTQVLERRERRGAA